MGLSISEGDKVFVSTEDAEIAELADALGAKVIYRPRDLATDTSPEWLAWQHAVQWVQVRYGIFDRFLSLPTTSPLRNQKDVLNCLHQLDESADVVIAITKASRSPWFNMVSKDELGNLRLLVDGNYERRQDTPEGYDLTTLAYVLRPNFILNHQRMWDGRVKGVMVPSERALNIDTLLDLEIARYLKEKNSF
jgi:N-acylneuraminate cytidylyltransferase